MEEGSCVPLRWNRCLRKQHTRIKYVAVERDEDPCLLTIVSTMFGLELRSVLAAKNTSTMLW